MTKTHVGPLLAGADATYALDVTNSGPTLDPGPITVTDPRPAGLTFVSATGPGWTGAANGSTVTCTLPGPLADRASSSISLVVAGE